MAFSGDHLHVEQVTGPRLSPRAVAGLILQGFDRHYALFRYSGQRPKALFESRNWLGIQQLTRERITYYDTRVNECSSTLRHALKGHGAQPQSQGAGMELTPDQLAFWKQVKSEYVSLLGTHLQPECAETFFNSVSTRILHRNYYNNNFLFVRPAVATEYMQGQQAAYRVYYPLTDGLLPCIRTMLTDFGLAAPFADLPADARRIARRAVHQLRTLLPKETDQRLAPDCQIQTLNSLFFRNKGAYVVGRLVNHGTVYPFAIALLHTPSGQIRPHALLFTPDDLSTLFSFTRAYFLVDAESPPAYVQFLSTLFPRKPKAEIYTAIGLHKQGKTLFYRDFLQHLAHSHDKFDLAPGIKGLVMTVFTLPSYPYVFKMIRDRINKDNMSNATVRDKYRLVKKHDRVGRMADTWEYSQVALPRNRFSDALLAELRDQTPAQIEETDDTVILQHVYIERRMMPLNLYISRASDARLEAIVTQYGQAIRDLAAANIFPGDMLFKNFGVTRLGRVVFYDYDEIQNMTEMNFRKIPPAPNEEAEMAAEPWYPIGPNDVFPEEFRFFLLSDPRVRKAFLRHHADLLEADWWQSVRDRVATGRIEDIFPYTADRQLYSLPSARAHAGA
ncbi:MAG TPA: bifunctional isocitrate dehydrogenase kinase/phosphatase [Burkholderiaceae bacterium]|nr:bifunctional isocitrate dehydrogenase kinase/phosphatase [Burkholderiaceae bacterium]